MDTPLFAGNATKRIAPITRGRLLTENSMKFSRKERNGAGCAGGACQLKNSVLVEAIMMDSQAIVESVVRLISFSIMSSIMENIMSGHVNIAEKNQRDIGATG
jgi:hypothetical protein